MDCLLVSQIYHGWTVITAHLEGTKGNSPCSKTLNIIQNIVTITEDGFSYTSSLKPCNSAVVYIISPKPILGSHYMTKIFFLTYVKNMPFYFLFFPWSHGNQSKLFPQRAIQSLKSAVYFSNFFHKSCLPFKYGFLCTVVIP